MSLAASGVYTLLFTVVHPAFGSRQAGGAAGVVSRAHGAGSLLASPAYTSTQQQRQPVCSSCSRDPHPGAGYPSRTQLYRLLSVQQASLRPSLLLHAGDGVASGQRCAQNFHCAFEVGGVFAPIEVILERGFAQYFRRVWLLVQLAAKGDLDGPRPEAACLEPE